MEQFIGHRVFGKVAGFGFFGTVVNDYIHRLAEIAGLVQYFEVFFRRDMSPVVFPDLGSPTDVVDVELDSSVLVAEQGEFGIPVFTPQLGIFATRKAIAEVFPCNILSRLSFAFFSPSGVMPYLAVLFPNSLPAR